MLFNERVKLEKEYYTWIEDNKEKFTIQDCPANVIAFLDVRGMFAISHSHLPNLENPILIKYFTSPKGRNGWGWLITICPFGKNPKVGSSGCAMCNSFISNDPIKNVIACKGQV